jgi:hypothetical protein
LRPRPEPEAFENQLIARVVDAFVERHGERYRFVAEHQRWFMNVISLPQRWTFDNFDVATIRMRLAIRAAGLLDDRRLGQQFEPQVAPANAIQLFEDDLAAAALDAARHHPMLAVATLAELPPA